MRWACCGVLIGWICGGVASGFAAEANPVTPAEFTAAFDRWTALKGQTNEPGRLRALFALQWRNQLAESPETATYAGNPEFDDRWSDLSPAARARRRADLGRVRRAVNEVDRAALGEDDRLYLELFDSYLRRDEAGLRFPEEFLLLNQLQGPQQEVAQTLTLMPRRTVRDVENLQARLTAIPRYLEQAEALLREGLAQGITPPRITLRDVPGQVEALIPTDPARSPLFQPFTELPPALGAEVLAAQRTRALATLTGAVYPAFRRFQTFLRDTYLPGARTNLACRELPDGVAWYAHRVGRVTTTTLTPEQIHEIGQGEVKRIRAEMDLIIKEVGFQGSRTEFFTYVRKDPQFFYATAPQLLAGYRDIAKRIDAELPRLFGRLPRMPYGVMPIPGYSERSQTTAYYQPGSLTAGRPGYFYANTYDLATRPKWEMEALTVHEAVPGHHLQLALAQEIEGAPDFQKHAETTVFVEGWGLYSESLGAELGLYRDPYSRFGQLTYEMWRAIRLVLDTGIHQLGWSRQQAIDFFRENAGKSEHDIVVEVDRYIVWPGQALAYKLGQLKILELRRLAERELGDRFDVRRFHDQLLAKGALPLDVLEPRTKAWIESEKGR
jgi:uncharacterized protein (DUF885 family)